MRLGVDAINVLADERGMGRVFRQVVRHAIDQGIDVTLLVNRRRPKRDYEATLVRERFTLAPTREARRPGRFDALWYPWNGIRFGGAAPSLVMIHDAFAFSDPPHGFVARRREQGPIVRAAREATQIVVNSQFSRAQVSRYLGLDPMKLEVATPEPSTFWSPGEPDELPAAIAGRQFFLAVGGAEARKNMAMLIAAYREAFGVNDPLLVIAGTLSEADEQRAKECGVVRLRPSDAALRSLYRAALAVAVPSRAEGFGLVVAEAMACGAAVIAARSTAIPEVAGDAALLVPPDDRAAWSAALRELATDGALRAKYRSLGAARWAFAARDSCARKITALLEGLRRR